MKKIKIMLANLLWMMLCAKSWFAFKVACHRPEAVQKKLLLRIIRRNQKTDFGEKLRFSSIRSIADFQRRVPLAGYGAYEEWIEKISQGKKNVLTAEDVSILEPTSGSTCATKLIPFTESLKEEFLAGISPWIFDLLASDIKILAGTAYWSITPTIRGNTKSSGGIPIGFKDDSEYFGKFERYLIGSVLSVPKEVSEISEMDNFRYATLLFLLKDRDLAFISVWNPTFLTILFGRFDGWKESLMKDIADGTISFPEKVNALVAKKLERNIRSDKKRALEIRSALGIEWQGECDIFWPKLSVISCWADGNSKHYLDEVKKIFPTVRIQSKGLLATEGVVSFPLMKERASALSLRSHFFEFIEQDISGEDGGCKMSHEIELGKTYAVIITTGGGLYRYRLGDLVTVVGFKQKCPLVSFQGRGGNVSDLFGEKLDERHISKVLSETFRKFKLSPRFFMVAPERGRNGETGYTLFLEMDKPTGSEKASEMRRLAEEFEKGLCQNFHYEYCRKLGQLSALRIFLVDSCGAESYLDACCSFGQKLGDIKMMTLRKEFGWSAKFSGSFCE